MAHKSIIRFIDNLFFIEGEKGVVGLGGCGGVGLGEDLEIDIGRGGKWNDRYIIIVSNCFSH